MLRVAGPSQGGLLSPADFASVPDVDADALGRSIGEHRLYEAPWAAEAEGMDLAGSGSGCAVCAVDVRRVFAALSYRRLPEGFTIEELELEAPLAAVPVMRGVTRVAPGARLRAPAPLALLGDTTGVCTEVVAAPAATTLGKTELSSPALHLRCHLATGEVDVVSGG
jgi:hypothetical protein